jgi:hypothetical protein
MRSVLVDWLVDVGEELNLRDDTLFLAVDLLDRFMSKEVRSLADIYCKTVNADSCGDKWPTCWIHNTLSTQTSNPDR